MKLEELNGIHRDPANWYLWFFYFAPADPRLVVKKRLRSFGWTINFARPLAIPFIVALAAAVFEIAQWLSHFQLSQTMQWGSALLMIAGVVALCAWLSNPRRHAE
jgi:hypothetical protein